MTGELLNAQVMGTEERLLLLGDQCSYYSCLNLEDPINGTSHLNDHTLQKGGNPDLLLSF